MVRSSLMPIVFLSLLALGISTGCAVFAETNMCAHCQPGFSLTINYTCSPCMSGCLQCITTSNCLLCTSNYTLNTGTCQPGPPHCLIVNNTQCMRCAIGYELINSSNSCTVCPNFCAQCESDSCLTCNYGFGQANNNS